MAKPKAKQSQAMQVLTSTNTVEYCTPYLYTMLSRLVLGGIDLDPASNAYAQGWIQAHTFYTEKQDGLKQKWAGRVFLNPPYDRTDLWVSKLENSFQQRSVSAAILLVNCNLGYNWFQGIWEKYPVCHIRRRISFIPVNGDADGQSKRASAFFLLTRRKAQVERFRKVFRPYGRILMPE